MSEEMIWLFLAGYALILLFFLWKTRNEQVRNRISWNTAIVGFLACVFWPITALSLLVVVAFGGGQAHRNKD